MRRSVYVAVLLAALVGGVSIGALLAGSHPSTSPTGVVGSGSPGSSSSPAASPAGPGDSLSPGASASPAESPSPSPKPTPVLVPAPLTGVLVTPRLAARHPIAVMIDDQALARPQSGFTNASIVWQAPAEGGIPRYMAIYAEGTPPSVGPVRSSRYYFIAWASEWRAMYVHVGGSPQAMSTLAAKGKGQYVYNADEFRYGGGAGYLWRIKTRFPPHNVYTDGKHLLKLASALKATAPVKPIWTFAPDAPLDQRPVGGTLAVNYPWNRISYTYDRTTNRYLRSVYGKAQVDAATKKRVAPANVVVMWMTFGPLNDGHPLKHRLEAKLTGSGKAWFSTNGRTVKGTWRKKSITSPTLFYDAAGQPIIFTIGQTFIQVVPTGTPVKIVAGKKPPTPSPSPSPSASPEPSPSP